MLVFSVVLYVWSLFWTSLAEFDAEEFFVDPPMLCPFSSRECEIGGTHDWMVWKASGGWSDMMTEWGLVWAASCLMTACALNASRT